MQNTLLQVREGLLRLKKLSGMVEMQCNIANVAEEENMVEVELMAWCWAEAGLLPMTTCGSKESTQVALSEVEAMGRM